MTQDGETGPERRPSVNVSLHGAAAKCCSWVHLGCLSRLGLPLACEELWCKGILQLTSRVRVRRYHVSQCGGGTIASAADSHTGASDADLIALEPLRGENST